MNARERYLATAAFKQVDRTFLLGNAWVAGVTSKSVTVNGPSTPSAGSGQAGSGDAKPWTEFNKDKETITLLRGLTGTVTVTAQY